jgi:hypothetical protein
MFADQGLSTLDENGLAYIDLDDIFIECIDNSNEYYVLLTKYGEGDIWVDDRKSTFFVAKGTPGLKFYWKIEAVQKDCNTFRLEEKDAPTADNNELDTDYTTLANEYLTNYEKELIA